MYQQHRSPITWRVNDKWHNCRKTKFVLHNGRGGIGRGGIPFEMVVGEKLFTSGSSTGSIPKSPSFHSSLELAEATGRQITSINCNIFDFTEMTTDNNQSSTATMMESTQSTTTTTQITAQQFKEPIVRNGLVARTIQTFARLQQQQQIDNTPLDGNESDAAEQHQQRFQQQNDQVDKENNTSSGLINTMSFAFNGGSNHHQNSNKFSINFMTDINTMASSNSNNGISHSGAGSMFNNFSAVRFNEINGINDGGGSDFMINNETTSTMTTTVNNCTNDTTTNGLDLNVYLGRGAGSDGIRLSPNNIERGSGATLPQSLRGQ